MKKGMWLLLVPSMFFATSCTIKTPGQIIIQPVDVTGVSINYESYTLSVNDTLQLKASVEPSNATNKNVTWKVYSGSSYASIHKSTGLVTALKVGTAKIKVTTEESAKTAFCTIKVVEELVPVTGVSLNETSLTIKQGQTSNLVATISPSNASNKSVTWSSSNESAVSVKNGVVTGLVAGGSATITAKTVEGEFTATCSVTVSEPEHATSVSLDKSEVTINEGKTLTLTPTVLPSDAYDKSVLWSSSNTTGVSVTDEGVIKGLKAGETSVITVTTNDGGHTATCNVTVTDKAPVDDWTVLIYMCGSDLESKNGLGVSDIKEIISVPNKPDDVNIIIETGGSTKWTANSSGKYSDGYSISSAYNQIHRVVNNKIVLDYQFTSKPKMGDSSTLQTFIEYGLEKYPADKTALILWNHGGGLSGVCFGYDSAGNYEDGLYGYEVCNAVKGALKNKGMEGEKLEMIGYDACLMQVQDIAEMNSQYFKYMVASEESEAGEGWDYDTWLDDLYAEKDTETVMKAIVDGFIADNGGVSSSRNDQTLSYLDLQYAGEYKDAWENMASALRSKVSESNKDDFNDLVDTVKHYADSDYVGYGLFDAKDFVNKLASNSTFKVDASLTNAVLTAHSKFVGYSSCGKAAGNSYGVCMFWCIDSSYKSDNPYEYGRDTNFSNWAYLSNTYCGSGSGGGGGWDDWDWGDFDW